MNIIKDIEQLRNPCQKVSKEKGMIIGISLLNELENLFEQGIEAYGLAANQIGFNARVFIAYNPNKKVYAIYVNPEILDKSGEISFTEGCLSFPNEEVKTKRFKTITVKDDMNPEPKILTDLEAIIFQHEYDHLDGITMHERTDESLNK